MSIHLILGPMFAGKSTELLRLAMQAECAGQKVLYVKHELDKMRNGDKICTHTAFQGAKKAMMAQKLEEVEHLLAEEGVDVICDDEGQFFEDLFPVAHRLASLGGKRVLIAALNATFTQQMFPSVCKLLPYAEQVQWLTAMCFRCNAQKAQFTFRLTYSNVIFKIFICKQINLEH